MNKFGNGAFLCKSYGLINILKVTTMKNFVWTGVCLLIIYAAYRQSDPDNTLSLIMKDGIVYKTKLN